MLHFEGDQEFPQPPATVFAKLSDAGFLAGCIPGLESVAKAETDEAVCTVKPGLSFVGGTLQVTLKVLERTPNSSAKLLAHAKGLGSSNDIEALLNLSPQDGGTHVHWSADAKNFTGLLKMVPPGLMQGAAQKVIADVWQTLPQKI